MRTKEELAGPMFNDDMIPLRDLLDKSKIPYEFKMHQGAIECGGKVKELIGYYPTGEWNIIIGKKYSVIRGFASFGQYEIMNIKNGKKFKEPERFNNPEDLIKAL